MSDKEKDMRLKWNKVQAALAEHEAVDKAVVELLAGMGDMPLSVAAKRVNEAACVVQTYATGVEAAVVEATSGKGTFTPAKRASRAKSNLYRAVEGLRAFVAEDPWGKQSWDDLKKDYLSDSSDSPNSEERDSQLRDGFKSSVEHVSTYHARVSDSTAQATKVANRALGLVALAIKAVEEAPDMETLSAAKGRHRRSIPDYMLCRSCECEFIHCQCGKTERGRKRAHDSGSDEESGSDKESGADRIQRVKVEVKEEKVVNDT